MNIIIITTGKRPDLLDQTVRTLMDNCRAAHYHRLVMVHDGAINGRLGIDVELFNRSVGTLIQSMVPIGASAARNIGASSIPKYRRQKYICFFDDDVFCTKDWDLHLEHAMESRADLAISGHAHPFNHSFYGEGERGGTVYRFTNVLSTVNIACSWEMWDAVGYFAEPGGPGGSEDVDWCRRATDRGYRLGVIWPNCVIHTGITSSTGKPIVGQDQVITRNKELEKLYGLSGQVKYR